SSPALLESGARRHTSREVAQTHRDPLDGIPNADGADRHSRHDLLDAGARGPRRPGQLKDGVRRHREEALARRETHRATGVAAPRNRDAEKGRATHDAGRQMAVEDVDRLLPADPRAPYQGRGQRGKARRILDVEL